MPRRQKNLKYGKISQSYPQGHGMSVKCEEPIDELTVQAWLLYHHPNFKYCTLFVSRTELRTDGRTDDPITRYPQRTFQAGDKKEKQPFQSPPVFFRVQKAVLFWQCMSIFANISKSSLGRPNAPCKHGTRYPRGSTWIPTSNSKLFDNSCKFYSLCDRQYIQPPPPFFTLKKVCRRKHSLLYTKTQSHFSFHWFSLHFVSL